MRKCGPGILRVNWSETLHLHYIWFLGSVKIINVTCIRYWNWKSARWMHFWYDTCHTSLSFLSNRKKSTPMKNFRFYIYSGYRNANIKNKKCKNLGYKLFKSRSEWNISIFLPTRATTMTPRKTLSALHTRCISTMDTSVMPETRQKLNKGHWME